MATYPVQNKITGEQKEVEMSVHDWDQWKEDNPDWFRFFTPENAPGCGLEVGEWKDKLIKTNQDGNTSLTKSRKLLDPTSKIFINDLHYHSQSQRRHHRHCPM